MRESGRGPRGGWRRPSVVLALVASVASTGIGCGGAARSPSAASDVAIPDVVELSSEDSAIGFRRSVVADEYFWLRAKVLEGEAPAPFADALSAMRDLRADLLADPTAWEDLDVPLGVVRNAAELASVYEALPPSKEIGERIVPLRERAVRLARAMEASDKAYRAGPFREHEAEISRAAKRLSQSFVPHIEAILGAIEADMALPSGGRPIVVTLVSDAPYPGIFAADARGLGAASFVRVRGLDDGALYESVLHELLHAIDELTVRSSTAMNTLRRVLAEHGLDASDPNVEMAVNTVTFAEAASLVRRFVDPHHRPLGEKGFYALYPPAARIVAAWAQRIEGASLDETSAAIAKAVLEP